MGGPNDSIIFVTLGPGVCFGEIALLGTGGMNRRTASIKVNIQKQNLSSDFLSVNLLQAHGFTTLFVLFKWDLQAAMKDYPEDQALLSRCKSFFVGKNSLIWQNFLAKILTVFKSPWLRNNLSKESSEGEERGGG